MALIGMVVYCTEENRKDDCLDMTLSALETTVDFHNNRLMLSINGYTDLTKTVIEKYTNIIDRQWVNGENLGTSGALNKIMRERKANENFIKIDDDIVINTPFWVEQMEEAINIDSKIGVIGLKRKDLIQTPEHPDPQYKSELILLPHTPGHRWITIERTADIIGSCTMFNKLLIEKIGYSRQPGKYGFEDNLYCHRSHLAGFYNCFLNHIDIDHVDNFASPYNDWKGKHSSDLFPEYHKLVHAMINGQEPIYYNPYK